MNAGLGLEGAKAGKTGGLEEGWLALLIEKKVFALAKRGFGATLGLNSGLLGLGLLAMGGVGRELGLTGLFDENIFEALDGFALGLEFIGGLRFREFEGGKLEKSKGGFLLSRGSIIGF